MADEEEIDPERIIRSITNSIDTTIGTLKRRFQELYDVVLKDSTDSPVEASSQYCQDFCRTLVEYAGCWEVEQDPVALVEVYTAALQAYSQASASLSPQCDSVPLVLERLALSFIELLLSLREELPASFWEEVRFSVQRAHSRLQESGIPQLSLLCSLTQQKGVWASPVLQGVLSQETQSKEQVDEFLEQEGPVLLEMRLKQLMKDEGRLKGAEVLAKACAEHPAFEGRGHFKQTHLICLCSTAEHHQLMEELSKVDCRDALEMICNLESDGDERVAFSLCSAFLTHQLLQADTYCAWELTLFWSKLLKRLESSEQDFLERCRKMSMLSKTVFHILFLIKVVQSEMDSAGLPTCIEMCIMALQLKSSDGNSKATICKTLSCLLSNDLEVKRACQLTEFLLEPTVDAYYAVESLYNEPDQKLEEENMPVSNSLRCELLLVFKTQWPFDPEFWDWRALKRQCLALMGEEASIVSSIDLLNDNEDPEGPDEEEGPEHRGQEDRRDLTTCFVDTTNELDEITDRRQKNREIKKLRQKGFVSARFRNFQAYMQYCVLCDKEFLGHRIVRHAQTHFKAGVFSCPICAETFTSKDTLVPHVASHVKQSSKERLTAMKNNKQLANPRTAAPIIAALKAKSENYLHTNGDSQGPSGGASHTARNDVSGFQVKSHEENVCPVSSCKKSFKFLKNLFTHVKAHGDNEEAKRYLEMQSNKVVCQYCLRQFVNVAHLNDHLQVHCGVDPYICIQLNCKASFQSNPELLVHRKSHVVFKARCIFPNCGKIFNEAFKLYDHEAQHYKNFTCKVPDCRKLFHSQNQLELHQEEHTTETMQEEQQITQHNSQQNLEQNPEQNSQQNSQNSGPSLIERMLSDSTSFSLEISHESKDFSCANVSSRQPPPLNSIESLLASPRRPLQDFGQYVIKSECQDMPCSSIGQTQDLDISAIRSSVNSNINSHPNRPMASPETHSFDHLRAALQSRDTPSFEAQTAGLHSGHANAFEDQTPMFSPNESPGSMMYSSNCNVTYPQQFPPTCTNMHPSDNGIPLGMCQTLRPSMTPLPPSGIRSGNAAPYPVNQATPSAQERHHCAFGNCTRNYSSYRSVTKHMRATHPEFYDQWKIARKNVKNPQGMLLANGSAGSTKLVPPSQTSETEAVQMRAIQKQVVHQPLPYPTMDPSSCYTSQLTSVQNHDAPLNMRNILNPIVVSQLASQGDTGAPMQSQVATTPQWHRNQGQGQIPAHVYPSNMQRMLQVDLTSGGLQLGHSMDPPLIRKRPHSVSASYIDGSDVGNSLQSFTSLSDNCSVSNYIAPAITKAKETHDGQMQDKFSSSCSSNNQYLNGETSESLADTQNKPRKRPKWPSIVGDGKHSCPRCSKQFNSSKSLGGHLSKRLTCKPLSEAQPAVDLPTSFLDFLNSEPTENVFNSQLLPDQSALHQEGLSQSVENTTVHPNAFPASGFTHADSPEMGSEDDILKRIMAEANMADLFDQPSVSQPFFQGTYGAVERMPQNSVIQHTGDVHLKEEQFYPEPYLQSNLPQYSSPIYPDPILSQILSENQNARPNPQSLPADHATTNQQTDIISIEAKQQTSMGLHSLAPSSVNHGESKWQSEQDVKKRLREQILSGDFTHRSCVFHSDNHSASSSSNSRPSNLSVHHSPSESRRVSPKKSRTPSSVPSGCPRGGVGFTGLSGSSSQQTGSLTLNHMGEQSETVLFSGVCRPWGIDDHNACGGPEKVGKVNGNIQTSVKQEEETGPTNVDPDSEFVKPFACHSEDCTFRAMSSDVLWKHMFRVHNYTLEMINNAKQRNAKLAPFGCHKCSKAFTRNSNRRVHYQTAHRMSIDEISKLPVKPTLAPVVQFPGTQNQTQTEADQNAIENESITLKEPFQGQPPLFGECCGKDVIQQNSSNDNCFTQVHRNLATQASTGSSLLPPQTVSGSDLSAGQYKHLPATPTRYSADRYGQLYLQSAPTPLAPLPSSPPKANITIPLDIPPITKTTSASRVERPIPEVAKKLKGKKSNAVFNPYRPYCCVHEGCAAAFTVQHNLILHYRAIHQSALSVLAVKKEQDGTDAADESTDSEEDDEEVADSENEFVPEFRCQEKDCCRVFQEVPSLLQHYLQLHEFSLDKAGAILSRINLGQFACDQQRCVAMFTSFWKYVGHIKELHGGVTLSRQETLNGFSCDVEDCNRTYATKYNLLRHTMKKHPETYQLKVLNQTIPEECAKQNSKNSHNTHYPIVKAIDGKENIQSNKKLQKVSEKKRPEKTQKNNWTKYGKPSLKSKGEASALCTKNFTLQYPCMLAGCESVMRSERSIMKHYMGHGLSERYLEEQRSHYIFCKKFSRLKHHSSRSDDSKSDNSSDLSDDDLLADTGMGGSEYLSAKPGLRKRVAAERSGGFFDGGPSDEDGDSVAVSKEPIVVKRKRGRPRKLVGNAGKPKATSRSTRRNRIVHSAADEETDSCDSSAYLALTPDDGTQLGDTLPSFKPMGFEVSFLKFLEHSTPPEQNSTRARGRPPGKKSSLHTKDTCVVFSNRQNFEALGKVRIVVDGAYSVVATLLLKQLQDMRPTVMLEKSD
ncbi:zinc finger protein 292b [Gadus morhua]|uniref:zinc finger protein 292b n=1 Tax=Gadus morhua TaxID=8049 RepID=UPI0011B5B525|nr:zinc finger protein 292-like [Gadus morhua]